MGLLDGALGDAVGGLMGGANAEGMLGGLLGKLGGGQAAGGNKMLAMLMSLVQTQGGLGGLLDKFKAGGHGDAVASWVGTGENAPISAKAMQDVLGQGTVTDLASKLGVDPSQAGASMATMLPELINQLTPNGKVDAGSNDLLAQGMAMLNKLQGK